jgi:hypothetical protein
MPKICCDHKIYKAYVSLFWAQRHGKCDVDRLFGALQELMAMFPLMSMDSLIALCARLHWGGKPVDAYAINATSMTDWAPLFKGQAI